jgi:hypothetical protein
MEQPSSPEERALDLFQAAVGEADRNLLAADRLAGLAGVLEERREAAIVRREFPEVPEGVDYEEHYDGLDASEQALEMLAVLVDSCEELVDIAAELASLLGVSDEQIEAAASATTDEGEEDEEG